MTKPTRRLPRGLKKKLEASLSSLTPREAGRLWLIYLHDAMEKGKSSKSYPPMDELETAWERRIDEAARRGPEARNAEVARYNGYHFLSFVAANTHDVIQAELWRVGFFVLLTTTRVDKLLHADAVSQLARTALDDVINITPRPVSRADYDRMLTWATTANLVDLDDAAEEIAGETFEPAYKTFTLDDEPGGPKSFFEAHKDRFDVEHYWEVKGDELRRVWVEEVGEARVLKDIFEGDRSRLEYWINDGYYTHPADPERFEATDDQVRERLAAMVEAGELVGGRGVYFVALYAPVLLKDGKLPTWAALRIAWGKWLADQGVFERPIPRVDTKTPDGVADLYDDAGSLAGREAGLVADFLKYCRSRPWGKGLAKKVDVEALAVWLTARENPLTVLDAPDLGLVDWETFRTHEGDEAREWEPNTYATAVSLTACAEALGLPAGYDNWEVIVDAHPDTVRENYYPVGNPEARRADLGRTIDLLRSLQTSQRAFTYREAPKKGQLSLQDLLGVEFYTPLEEAVRNLGAAFGLVATVRKTVTILEEKYFDGLALLDKDLDERVEALEETLAISEADLASWIDRLSKWPWAIETSSLQLFRAKADDDRAAEVAAMIEKEAGLPLFRDKVDIDFGDGPMPAMDYLKGVGR